MDGHDWLENWWIARLDGQKNIAEKIFSSRHKTNQDLEPRLGVPLMAGTEIGQSCEALKHVIGLKNKIRYRD